METTKLLLLLLFALLSPLCAAQTDSLPAATPEKVWRVVEEMPTYRGGRPAWEQYLRQNLRFPEEARRTGVKGSVYVGFTVGEDGSILNPQVLRGIRPDCDREALRLIAEMPNWVPGRQNGRAVPVYLALPVKFIPKP
jgi:TonB family protein